MNSFYDNLKMAMVLTDANIDDAEQDSAFVDMSTGHRVAFVAEMTATPAAAVIDVLKLVQATDSSGTGKKDITGAAITSFVNFDTAGDQVILELDAIGLDFDNLFKFVAVTIGGDADNTDQFVSIFAINDTRFKHELLNGFTAAEVLTNFKKTP